MRSRRFLRVVVVVVLSAVSESAAAQCSTWVPLEEGGFLTSHATRALISWDPDGAGPSPEVLVAGGDFPPIGNIGQWNGTSWQPLGAGTSGTVLALAVYNGELIVGGDFIAAGGGPTARLARWNGSSWQSFGGAWGNVVRALTVFNGELIVAGEFGAFGNGYIAAWNGSTWHTFGTGVNGPVTRMAVNGGELVVGGDFTLAGGSFAGRLARWNGSSWLTGFTGLLAHADALAIYNGEIIIGGHSLMSGSGMSYIIRGNGSTWQPLGMGTAGLVGSLLVRNGELVVGGSFPTASGVPCNNVASWNGASWSPIGSGIPTPNPFTVASEVFALTEYRGELIAGGLNFQFPGVSQYSVTASFAGLVPPSLAQPGGPGTGVVVTNKNLIPGHEYYNIASFDLCGVQGSGPYGGLCFNDLSFLNYQFALPVGSHPFHFVSPTSTLVVGPYPGPIGFTLDAVCADVTGGVASCISNTLRFTVQ